MKDLIEIDKYPVKDVLPLLLKDKTTGNNIIFATDTYSDYGYSECNYKWGIIIQDTNDLLRYCQLSNVGITDIQSKKCEETINDLKRIMMA